MKLIARVLIALSLIGTSTALAQATAAPSQSSGVASSVAITPGYYGRTTRGSGYGSALGFLRGSSRPVFVVPAGETALEDLLAANEDMTVMTRIFGRALEQANLGGGASNPFVSFLGQSSQSAPSVYLDGYGALFTLSVDFPLAPGSQEQETPPQEDQAESDPLWQEMRADIFEPAQADRGTVPFEADAPEYSAQKVENLKATLIAALKHASNIRALGPDDVVVVTVVGAGVPGQLHGIKSIPGTDEFELVDDQGRTRITADRLADVTRSAPTVLMIRATASAISAFAKGQSNLAQFREQVRVLQYPHLAQMMESGPTVPGARLRSGR
jgi:hypothetical protein